MERQITRIQLHYSGSAIALGCRMGHEFGTASRLYLSPQRLIHDDGLKVLDRNRASQVWQGIEMALTSHLSQARDFLRFGLQGLPTPRRFHVFHH